MSTVPSIDPASVAPGVLELCRRVCAAGGRALLVGGGVRDRLRGEVAKDDDVEVFGLDAEALSALLADLGEVNTVGASFTVYKLRMPEAAGGVLEVDVSLPRRDSKVARGHRGFRVTGDPAMRVEEAARRRDFTVNAILYDPLAGEILDPFDGVADIERGVLRAVDPEHFVEDSLRVLRAVQLAARLGYDVDAPTRALCRGVGLDDLPRERVWGEMEKLLLAPRPSVGLRAALDLCVLAQLFPEIEALVHCPQDPRWHPEGDVFTHTLLAMDVAAELAASLRRPERLAVLLAVLLHDVGKPATTKIEGTVAGTVEGTVEGTIEGERVRSPGHEAAARAPAERVLDALNVHTLEGYPLRDQVLALVTHHLKPAQFHRQRDEVGDGAFRRLARRCDLGLLHLVAKADALARGPASNAEAPDWFIERARALALEGGAPEPLLKGRHVLALGVSPGPRVGEILEAVYGRQLDGEVATLDEALAAARALADAGR